MEVTEVQHTGQAHVVVPMVIFFEDKCIHSCIACEKSSQKTLEQKHVWHVHPVTHKIVPLEPTVAIRSLISHKTSNSLWYKVVAQNNPFDLVDAPATKTSFTEKTAKVLSNSTASDNDITFLIELYQYIKDRKRKKKDGSYTTHLFNSGDDKIRKKLGEEVIEVILSRSKQEMIEESADLLYHLLVLFVNNDISFYNCVATLRSRHSI